MVGIQSHNILKNIMESYEVDCTAHKRREKETRRDLGSITSVIKKSQSMLCLLYEGWFVVHLSLSSMTRSIVYLTIIGSQNTSAYFLGKCRRSVRLNAFFN